MALAAADRNAPNEKVSKEKEMDHLREFLPKAPGDSSRSDGAEGTVALSEMRKIHIPFNPQLQKLIGASAHFVISFTSSSKPAKVVLESGAEELCGAIPAITAAMYPQTVPDSTPARIPRRGNLSCNGSTNDGGLVLMPDTEMASPGFQVIGAPAPPHQLPTPGP